MPITPENVHRHELIGLQCEVVEHSDPTLEGVSGEVLDETMNTLKIGEKTVEKEHGVFVFELPSGESVELDGEEIHDRPEDRV